MLLELRKWIELYNEHLISKAYLQEQKEWIAEKYGICVQTLMAMYWERFVRADYYHEVIP